MSEKIILPTAPPVAAKSWPRRIVGALIAIPAALWIFLEEWLWDSMLAFMAWLGRLPPIRWAEHKISQLPPYAALVAFLIPALVLLPFKLAAFWLIAKGQTFLGAVVFIVAKIIGTAFLARIFSLTKNALLTIGWFARAYRAVLAWKERLYAYVRAIPTYQTIRALLHEAKMRLKTWWRTLFGS